MRVGVIGAGWWATTNHLPILAARHDVDLVGVCRPDPSVLHEVQQKFGFTHATEDYHELLAMDLDAVVVASPHHLHFEHARAALERGLHVLVEKPMTLNAQEAWTLVQSARDQKVHALVALGWHYQPFVIQARQFVADGLLGEIEYVQCHMASPTIGLFAGTGTVPTQWEPTLVAPDPRTWQRPDAGGGYGYGQITHSSALAFWLTGLRATQVGALTSNANAPVDLYDAAHITFDNGAIGALSGAGTLPDDDKFQIDIRIFGTDGVLLLDVERERLCVRRRDGHHHEVPVPSGAGAYNCEVPPARLIELITGASTENNSPLENSARSVELIQAMHHSAACGGRPISIPDSDPEHIEGGNGHIQD